MLEERQWACSEPAVELEESGPFYPWALPREQEFVQQLARQLVLERWQLRSRARLQVVG